MTDTIDIREWYCGIDPGVSGGICVIDSKGNIPLFRDTPKDEYKWRHLFKSSIVQRCNTITMEKTSGYIGRAHPGSRMYEFGRNAGRWEGMILMSRCRLPNYVSPQEWQKALGIDKKGKKESREQFKRRLKRFAQEMFPQIIVTGNTADAILIAEYARRVGEGFK